MEFRREALLRIDTDPHRRTTEAQKERRTTSKDAFQRILAGLVLVGIFVGLWFLSRIPAPIDIHTPAPIPPFGMFLKTVKNGKPMGCGSGRIPRAVRFPMI